MTLLMTLNQHKIENHVIFSTLMSEPMDKLINRIPGSFDVKFTKLGFENTCSIARQALQCQHAVSKLCLVHLISKDFELVFSIYCQAT